MGHLIFSRVLLASFIFAAAIARAENTEPINYWHEPGAKSVVFVCSANESMQATFPQLQEQLYGAIRLLDPATRFNVILASGPKVITSAPRPIPATLDNKIKAMELIERTTPAGDTNLVPAMREGITERPEVLFLATAHFGKTKSAQFVDEVNRMNPARLVQIDTACWSTEELPGVADALTLTATGNRGTFWEVKGSSVNQVNRLGARPPVPVPVRPAPPTTLPAITGKRVVFIVDATAAMQGQFDRAAGDVVSLIDGLDAGTTYDVLLVKENRPLLLSRTCLAPTPQTKQQATTFLSTASVRGPGDAEESFKAAFGLAPDQVLFLTAGRFAMPYHLLLGVRTLNAANKVKVDVLLYPGTSPAVSIEAMRWLAESNGGTFITRPRPATGAHP